MEAVGYCYEGGMNGTYLSLCFVHFPWPYRWEIHFGTRISSTTQKGFPPNTLWHSWGVMGPPLRHFWQRWRFFHTVHLKLHDGRYAMRCWLTDGAADRLWVDGVTEQWAAVRAGWMRAA